MEGDRSSPSSLDDVVGARTGLRLTVGTTVVLREGLSSDPGMMSREKFWVGCLCRKIRSPDTEKISVDGKTCATRETTFLWEETDGRLRVCKVSFSVEETLRKGQIGRRVGPFRWVGHSRVPGTRRGLFHDRVKTPVDA